MTPDLPITVPPPSTIRLSNCISKCKINTVYTNIFTNGSINTHSSFSLGDNGGDDISFNYIQIYTAKEDTNSNLNIVKVNQLSTYFLSEIRIYSPPINTYTNQENTIDSEIVCIHTLRNISYIDNSIKSEIPTNLVFFIPSNVKVSDGDIRDYTIQSLLDDGVSYDNININLNDIIPKKSKFYSYISTLPITTSESLTKPEFIHGLSIIFDISPVTSIGINKDIIQKCVNNINGDMVARYSNICGIVTNISYAPMGLNANTNSYYLSCGDVSPSNPEPTVATTNTFLSGYKEKAYDFFILTVGNLTKLAFILIFILIMVAFFSGMFSSESSESNN